MKRIKNIFCGILKNKKITVIVLIIFILLIKNREVKKPGILENLPLTESPKILEVTYSESDYEVITPIKKSNLTENREEFSLISLEFRDNFFSYTFENFISKREEEYAIINQKFGLELDENTLSFIIPNYFDSKYPYVSSQEGSEKFINEGIKIKDDVNQISLVSRYSGERGTNLNIGQNYIPSEYLQDNFSINATIFETPTIVVDELYYNDIPSFTTSNLTFTLDDLNIKPLVFDDYVSLPFTAHTIVENEKSALHHSEHYFYKYRDDLLNPSKGIVKIVDSQTMVDNKEIFRNIGNIDTDVQDGKIFNKGEDFSNKFGFIFCLPEFSTEKHLIVRSVNIYNDYNEIIFEEIKEKHPYNYTNYFNSNYYVTICLDQEFYNENDFVIKVLYNH